MLTALDTLNARTRKFPSRLGRLRAVVRALLPVAALAISGCAEEEPHYLPPLPDMRSGMSNGLPCEVSKLLAKQCLGCHGQPPAGSPLALVTHADLTAKSTLDPGMNIAERALVRMQSTTYPMPPGPTATVPASELLPMQMWVTAGAPMTTCTN